MAMRLSLIDRPLSAHMHQQINNATINSSALFQTMEGRNDSRLNTRPPDLWQAMPAGSQSINARAITAHIDTSHEPVRQHLCHGADP